MTVAKTSPDLPNNRLSQKSKLKPPSYSQSNEKRNLQTDCAPGRPFGHGATRACRCAIPRSRPHRPIVNYAATNNTWDFHVGSDTLGAEFPPDQVVLKIKPAAQTTVPPIRNSSFLGTSGAPCGSSPGPERRIALSGIWRRRHSRGRVCWRPGQGGTEERHGAGELLFLPGGRFGTPQVLFNSADGISTNDVATVQGGGDAHLNWAFSQPAITRSSWMPPEFWSREPT